MNPATKPATSAVRYIPLAAKRAVLHVTPFAPTVPMNPATKPASNAVRFIPPAAKMIAKTAILPIATAT